MCAPRKSQYNIIPLIILMIGMSFFVKVEAQYCTPTANCIGNVREIELVQFGGINNNSAGSCSGYNNFTAGTPANVEKGKSYCMTVGYDGGGSDNIKVYIDFNGDTDFLDAGELVVSQGVPTASNATVTFDIFIPTTVTVSSTRMRVMWKSGTFAGSCTNLGSFGEIEDYTVNISADPPPTTAVYQNAYGAAGNDEIFYDVIQTTDGGFLKVGETETMGAGLRDVYVVKTDNTGAVTWSATYGGSNNDSGQSVEQTNDGGFIIGGWSQSFGGSINFYMIKISVTGVLQWAQVHGDGTSEYGYDIIQTSDGGYIMCGEKQMAGTDFDTYVVKTNSTGALTWANSYGSGSGGGKGVGTQIMEVGCNNYIVTGTADDKGTQTGQKSFHAFKINSSGGLIWGKIYQRAVASTNVEESMGSTLTNDGGFIMAGSGNNFTGAGGGNDGFVVKADANGIVQWGNTYGGSGTERFNSIQQTKDGGFIMAGKTLSFGTSTTFLLVKTSNSGAMTWAKAYSGTGAEEAYAVRETSSFIMVGRTTSFGVGLKDGYTIKTDDNGDSEGGAGGCNSIDASSTVSIPVTGQVRTDDISTVGAGNARTTITASASSQGANVTGSTDFNGAPGTILTDACSVILPIELISFSGKKQGTYNLLEWTTKTEINNDYFVIEKSLNTTSWDEVEAVLGSGNSNTIINYSTKDFNPSDKMYYRLKQVDFNGQIAYSNIIKIENRIEITEVFTLLPIYPNPATQEVNISIKSLKKNGDLSISIHNYLGQRVYNKKVQFDNFGFQIQLDLASFSKGIYNITIEFVGQNVTHSTKLIKQ